MEQTTPLSAEEQIILLLRQRDTAGVSLLYDKYSSALFGVILRIVGKQEVAEEVLQDVFTKVWRNFDSYDVVKGRLFTWLINIARNSAIDATRAKGFNIKNYELENVVNTIDAQNNTTPNIEGLDLKHLTEKLNPDYRILIDLLYFQGFTQAEAAENLKIPLGTVKTRIRAAILQLKEMF